MTTDTELSYEQQRLKNIKDNEQLLLSLGLTTPSKLATPARAKPKAKSTGSAALRRTASVNARKKRVDDQLFTPSAQDEEDEEEESGRPKRRALGRANSNLSLTSTPRRSARSSVKVERYSDFPDSPSASPRPSARSRFIDDDDDVPDGRQRNAKRMGVRTQDPKTFGHIPGVEVGRWWPSRIDASTDAVHAPTVAGISGNAAVGAWSVALSGGYPDEWASASLGSDDRADRSVDLGMAFTYTGSGGRDLKGTKQNPKNLRTAPQTSHQTFDNPLNAALKRSAETKRPIRVIRGFKLQSPYAPAEGYRYDGLYRVERAWMAKGLTAGLMVCRYAFKRLPGQPPLGERDEAEAEARADAGAEAEAVDGEDAKVDVDGDAGANATLIKKEMPKKDTKPRKESKPVVESTAEASPAPRRSSRRSGAANPDQHPDEPSPGIKPRLAKRKLEASSAVEEPPVKRARQVVVDLVRRGKK